MADKGDIVGMLKERQMGLHSHLTGHEHEHFTWPSDVKNKGHRVAGFQKIHALFTSAINFAEEESAEPAEPDTEAWKSAFQTAMELIASRQQDAILLQRLEREVAELRKKIESCGTVIVPIRSLAPWGLEVVKDIPAVVQNTDDDYVATFFDANIAMSGDSQEEAVGNLRALIADMFDSLVEEESVLGPEPARQLATLREFIKKRV